MTTPSIIPVTEQHLPAILSIYNHYVAHSTATFHTHLLTIDEMRGLVFFQNPRYGAYTIISGDGLAGYVLLTQHKAREAYNSTAEVTIYLSPDFTGKGLGRVAVNFIECVARQSGFHALIATVCGENTQSLALFERCGYERCAHYKEVGYKFNRYLDLIALEKLL